MRVGEGELAGGGVADVRDRSRRRHGVALDETYAVAAGGRRGLLDEVHITALEERDAPAVPVPAPRAAVGGESLEGEVQGRGLARRHTEELTHRKAM